MKCVEGRCEWVPIYYRTLLLSIYLCNVHIFVREIIILPSHVLTAIMFIRTCDMCHVYGMYNVLPLWICYTSKGVLCGSVVCFVHTFSLSRMASMNKSGSRQKKPLPLLKSGRCGWSSMPSQQRDIEPYKSSLLVYPGTGSLE